MGSIGWRSGVFWEGYLLFANFLLIFIEKLYVYVLYIVEKHRKKQEGYAIRIYFFLIIIAYFHGLPITLHPKQKPMTLPFMPQWAHHKVAVVQASHMLQLKT